jgi:NADH-quinone oxidoreductase subunit N
MHIELFEHINVILDELSKPTNFLSCTNCQWQAFNAHFASYSFLEKIFTLSWWLFMIKYLHFDYISLISIDMLLYIALLSLVLQFGRAYSKHSAHALLNISGNHSKKWFVLISVIFAIQICYFDVVDFSCLHGLYQFDYFTQAAKGVMLILWFGLFMFLDSLASSHSQGIAEFPILSHLILCLSFTMVSAGDFALLLICLEGFSLILYVMATIGRLQGGIAAAIKYFSFGTAGSILMFWGAIHFYEVTSSLSFQVVFYTFDYFNEHFLSSYLVLAKLEWAAAAIVIGMLVKLGVAPMHQWVPDVYSGVPLFITAFYSILVKFVIYILFLRLSYHFNTSGEIEYAALISLVVGCFGTLRQVEIKRFLAYSSITHMGFLLIGDLPSSLVYLSAYMLSSFVFFSVLLNLRINGKEFIYLADLRHIAASTYQWDRFLLVLALASMAGLPPFAGFYGKMMVWSSLMEDIYLFNDLLSFSLLLVNFITSLIIIFYYMRLIILIYIGYENSNKAIVRSYLYNFWKDSASFNDEVNVVDTISRFPKLSLWKFYCQKLINCILLLARQNHIAGSWFNEIQPGFTFKTYINIRNCKVKSIQYICAFFLFFWTIFMPSILTILVDISETISLAWIK